MDGGLYIHKIFYCVFGGEFYGALGEVAESGEVGEEAEFPIPEVAVSAKADEVGALVVDVEGVGVACDEADVVAEALLGVGPKCGLGVLLVEVEFALDGAVVDGYACEVLTTIVAVLKLCESEDAVALGAEAEHILLACEFVGGEAVV